MTLTRNEKFKAIAERIDTLFPMPLRVCLSNGLLDSTFDAKNVGFLKFGNNTSKLDVSLFSELAIIMPHDGSVNFEVGKPSREQIIILVITKSDANIYAEAVAHIISKQAHVNSISTNINYLCQIGVFPYQFLPDFAAKNYSVAAINASINYTTNNGYSMECFPNCCQNTIELGCLERCEAVTITGLQASTDYGVFIQVPHSSTSQKLVITSDSSGNLELPINAAFSGDYKVRLHQNNGIAYDCYYFTINP